MKAFDLNSVKTDEELDRIHTFIKRVNTNYKWVLMSILILINWAAIHYSVGEVSDYIFGSIIIWTLVGGALHLILHYLIVDKASLKYCNAPYEYLNERFTSLVKISIKENFDCCNQAAEYGKQYDQIMDYIKMVTEVRELRYGDYRLIEDLSYEIQNNRASEERISGYLQSCKELHSI